MRDVADRNAKNAAEMSELAGTDIRPLELDVQSEPSVDAAVAKIVAESDRIDVLVHNAGHMMFGPAEAFKPEQFAQQYDVNVLGTQRVNRAVLKPSAIMTSSSTTRTLNPFTHSCDCPRIWRFLATLRAKMP